LADVPPPLLPLPSKQKKKEIAETKKKETKRRASCYKYLAAFLF